MNCLNCGHPVKPEYIFCPNCGSIVPEKKGSLPNVNIKNTPQIENKNINPDEAIKLINNLNSNISSRNRTILIFVIFSVLFFLSFLCFTFLTGSNIIRSDIIGGFFVSFIYFSISIPFSFLVLYLLRLLDMYEKEDWSHIIFSFLWGALGATFFSLIANEINATLFTFICGKTMGDICTASLSAPIFEEMFKMFAVVIIILFLRSKFNSPIDGMVYAASAGLGFKLVEDFLYISRGIAQGGFAGGLIMMIFRWIFGFLLHSLMTSFVGFAIGFATLTKEYYKKILYVLSGYLLSAGSHFLWNFTASMLPYIFGNYACFIGLIVYPLYTVIYISLNILLYIRALNVEKNILKEVLQDELNEDLINNDILYELININSRSKRKNTYTDNKFRKLYDIYMNILASYALLKKQYLNSQDQNLYKEMEEKRGVLYVLKPILFSS